MSTRREFLRSAAAPGIASLVGVPAVAAAAPSIPGAVAGSRTDSNGREYWLSVMEKIAEPVLANLSRRQLRKTMPVEAHHSRGRAPYAHLEAFGRLMAGIAPWLGVNALGDREAASQRRYIAMAQTSLDAATDPASPDFMNFRSGAQPLADGAFLAQGILRCPGVLRDGLEARVRRQLVDAFKSLRTIDLPMHSNWVLFAAMVEMVLMTMGETTIEQRLEGCLRRMLGWYKGDGLYGDGEYFHFDYYNSYVIHPMLIDVLNVLRHRDERFRSAYDVVLRRAQRYAEIQERLIAPDGTFPAVGRSIAYRSGAFHLLAQMARMGQLPDTLKPAQVREGMTAMLRTMFDPPATFDQQGWLRIGLHGHQPSLAEPYISTGSLYLCSVALLPLGLAPDDAFWRDAPTPWTSKRLFSGDCLPPDHALADIANVEIPSLMR